ncbi:hypothetical protein OAG21_03495 [Akkermansiaceae bacterium]|nr:hypothetical protein [Akkermansiaceae bacterium]MDB4764286.1 hypothetical protein [Akkermansiaceae bacterium]
MRAKKYTTSVVRRLGLTIALGALLASCDSKNDGQTQAEEASKEIATTEAIKKHPGCKDLGTIAKESGSLTIQKQKYAEANKSVVFYHKLHFFDLVKENDSLILSFNDYFSNIDYRIECKEEQLTALLSEKDGFEGELLVFFTVSGFRKPIFSNSEDSAGPDVYLVSNDVLIGSGSLVEIVNLDK